MQLDFAKGHGTLNDFVIVADPDGAVELSREQVRFLCDRRAGVGADGLLRVVRARHIAGWDGDPGLWFMDYRNGDGSVSEMCGNGVRVFLRYLEHAGLVAAGTERLDIGTRAGVRTGHYLPDGRLRVWMGRPVLGDAVAVESCGARYAATAVDVGNPHAVSPVASAEELAGLDLTAAPSWAPEEVFPAGANLEFVHRRGQHELAMRVYERGVGETSSCGTGTVAAALASARAAGQGDASYTVHVPGGTLVVDLEGEDAYLTGPAQIVFAGRITVPPLEGPA